MGEAPPGSDDLFLNPVALPTKDSPSEDQSAEDSCYCPHFQHAIELIGRRWTGSILKVVGEQALRFGEIRQQIPGLSDRLLDTRLTELESEGVLSRTENHGEVRYSATPKGVALGPVFDIIGQWAYENSSQEDNQELPGRRRC